MVMDHHKACARLWLAVAVVVSCSCVLVHGFQLSQPAWYFLPKRTLLRFRLLLVKTLPSKDAFQDADSTLQLKTSDDYFHMGMRLYKDCYDQGKNAASLQKAALLFQRAIELETTKIKTTKACDNLLVALRALATVHATVDDSQNCLQVMDEIRWWKSCRMPFPKEEPSAATTNCTNDKDWEWIYAPHSNHKVALRTKGPSWLDAPAIASIQTAAQQYRKSNTAAQSSSTRFTMQYTGNSDLHVADLVAHQPALEPIFDELLQTRVYPLVRAAYLPSTALSLLCVYDALIVRYDGDAATQQGRATGASLPLHRDGGLFSVNIALQDDGDEGGTLFDRLLLGLSNNTKDAIQKAIQRPIAPGSAVVHRSTERHAGAPTKTGVREILVIFLTLRPESDPSPKYERGAERAFYLKELAQKQQLPMNDATINRLYQWAVQENPLDGEALFWVAHSQIQNTKQMASNGRRAQNMDAAWRGLQSGIASLERVANELDPCNVRTLAFLASSYSFRWGFALENHPQAFGLNGEEELNKAAAVLKKAIYLANVFEVVFEDDSNALVDKSTLLILLGEVLFHQGQYQSAMKCLREVPAATKNLPETLRRELRSVAEDMFEDCTRQ